MPYFTYIARSKDGKKVSGSQDATNKDELTTRLQAQDLLIINIQQESTKKKPSGTSESKIESRFKHRHARITSHDMVLFCRQLATLLGAGVTILQSLKVISRQVSSSKLGTVLINISEDMEKGLSLHEAMGRHPGVFSDLWVNLVESGEASGNLAVVLGRLASYLERNAEFQRKIISSLIYPLILLVVALGALFFLTIKIIPTFAQLFEGFNIALPLITKVLIVTSNFVRRFSLVILIVVTISFLLFRQYIKKNKDARKRFEMFLFRLPVFGEFFRSLVVERFSSGMATLVESGVPILYALEISERSVGNVVVAEIIHRIKEDVRGGKSLSRPLERSGFFEPMVVQMVAIGEEIGELSPMLKRINQFYQQYADTFLVRFTSMFEPLMLIFIGLLIGIMVIGMFLPIFQITQIK
jgi:type IV pilus assembly protein PilC